MTRRPLAGVVLSEADARARGLVPTREAATIYGCDPNSLPKAMRRVGYVGAWVHGKDRASYWCIRATCWRRGRKTWPRSIRRSARRVHVQRRGVRSWRRSFGRGCLPE
jgi:hypothetical protein